MSFLCPICHSSEYQRVVVPRPPRDPYETEFFTCLGCSALFLEPELFTAAPTLRQAQDTAAGVEQVVTPGSGAPIDAMRSQEQRYRFWKARAKREAGGFEPTTEQVLRLRDRYRQ